MSENYEDHVELYNNLTKITKKIDWKIAHFNKIVLTEKVIQSKTISMNNPRANSKICDLNLEIYKSIKNNYFYFTINSTAVAERVLFEANVQILDAKMKEKLHEANFSLREYEKGQKIQPPGIHLIPLSTVTDSKEKYLAQNGVLNVRCEIVFLLEQNEEYESFTGQESLKIGEFCSTLYDNKDFSDVILAVGESKIYAHKLVLSARSEYFAAMFRSDFIESKDKVVEIEEDEELFKQMIQIFYNNDVSKVDFEVALELIVLARKYLVEELVKSCEKIIIKNKTVENCLEILSVADSIQSKPFKDRAIGFISANIKSISKTPEWENLKTEKPDLLIEIAAKMMEQSL